MSNKAFGALAIALAVAPSTALADLSADVGEWESEKRGALGLSGGLYYPDSTALQEVYDESLLVQWNVNLGYRIIDPIRLDGGMFFLVANGKPLGRFTDTSSAESSSLTLFGFNLGPTLRLDLFREQPIVPYGSAGVSWAIFREQDTDTDEAVVGDKSGWFYCAGIELLLDRLEPARAADLDISRGINDTYVTLEYRRQILTEVGETSSLDFSADTVSVGLKFDF